MERLTTNHEEWETIADLYNWLGTHNGIKKDDIIAEFKKLYAKLRAYENTELEPSEVEELRAVADKAKVNTKERIDEFDMLPNYYKKAEKRIALLDKALDRAVMLSGGKVTREGLLGVAEQELKVEGENEN